MHVYIIDTGIDTAPPDLNVVRHVNFAAGPNRDCHGHGTHVAGPVATTVSPWTRCERNEPSAPPRDRGLLSGEHPARGG